MNQPPLKMITKPIKYWYVPLIIGLLFIALGIWVFMQPVASYLGLAMFFSFSFLFSGMFEVFFAWSNRHEMENYLIMLIFGLLNIVIGLVLLSHPGLSALALSLYIGFAILFRSAGALISSLDLRKHGVPAWKETMLIGVLGIIAAIVLIMHPVFTGMTVMFWTAVAFVICGAFGVYFSLKLRKVHQVVDHVATEITEKRMQA